MTEIEAIEGEIVSGLSLPDLATRANEAHAKANEAGKSMVSYAIEAGEALAAAKQRVLHGEWLPWLEANFDGSRWTASAYMRLSANGERVTNLISDETSIRGALEAIRTETTKAEARERQPAPITDRMDTPDGKYNCIVLDPPWPMQKIERDERPNQGIALDYSTMSLEEIADESLVPVRSLADENCHIYLWVTHKFLPAGMDLLSTWGFNYQCVMTWRKNVGITPYSWMYDTEHVLFGRRGNLPLSRLGLRLSFEAPVQGHSIKPDVFYERVREASPGPRIDMFPGVEHEGFEPWGLEATHRGVV